MSIESVSDVLTRITSIEQQLQQLSNGSLLDGGSGVGGTSSSSSTGSPGTSSSAAFASELAQAQSSGTTTSAGAPVADYSGASFGSLGESALGSTATTATGTSAGVALPASASGLLTSGQQQFASTLAADTGLNPSVITSWLLAEESGGGASARQAAGNNDWLNIGYTDSGTYGASDSVWSDPVTAANATAAWMSGQDSIAGYGTASSGIQAILATVGQTPEAQIQAIQNSGWASSGYPSLGALYARVTGH